MPISALSIIIKEDEQPECLSTDEFNFKTCYMAIKRNETLIMLQYR